MEQTYLPNEYILQIQNKFKIGHYFKDERGGNIIKHDIVLCYNNWKVMCI